MDGRLPRVEEQLLHRHANRKTLPTAYLPTHTQYAFILTTPTAMTEALVSEQEARIAGSDDLERFNRYGVG